MTTSSLINKKKGRFVLIENATFTHNGISYRVNYKESKRYSPLSSEILVKFIDEICAMREYYSRVFAFRFDLHVPQGMPIEQSNVLISQLFSKIRDKFRAKNWDGQPIKKFAYGWVWEIEKAKQAHYHAWIAVPGNQVWKTGHRNTGMFRVISELWSELTEGKGLSHLPSESGHMISRADNDKELRDFVYRVSYLAKDRGKYSLGDNTKRYDGSRLHGKMKRKSAILLAA
ncbi:MULTISPECIES: YagK/YfjJ domain-containing protein [unclassified Serratia (in: enterobacteria)]|uniref:YagK/YfjJ domain-containing protein n=1 Tax=unclassified Serratia (in: enterobacteria) TaxID=2647522 RepID=UPI00307659F7